MQSSEPARNDAERARNWWYRTRTQRLTADRATESLAALLATVRAEAAADERRACGRWLAACGGVVAETLHDAWRRGKEVAAGHTDVTRELLEILTGSPTGHLVESLPRLLRARLDAVRAEEREACAEELRIQLPRHSQRGEPARTLHRVLSTLIERLDRRGNHSNRPDEGVHAGWSGEADASADAVPKAVTPERESRQPEGLPGQQEPRDGARENSPPLPHRVDPRPDNPRGPQANDQDVVWARLEAESDRPANPREGDTKR